MTVKEVKIFVVVSNKKMLICDLVMILSLSLCSSVCVLVVLRLRRVPVLVTHATTTTGPSDHANIISGILS